MPKICEQVDLIDHVPHLHRPIRARLSQALPIRGPGQSRHSPFKIIVTICQPELPAGRLPDLHDPIIAPSGDVPTPGSPRLPYTSLFPLIVPKRQLSLTRRPITHSDGTFLVTT